MKTQILKYRKSILVIIFLVISIGVYAATKSALLDVDEIEVYITGGQEIGRDDVISMSGIALSQSMTSVNTESVETLLSDNSWVEEVEVEKKWPNTVSIWVALRKPFANALTSKGELAVIDETGIVIEDNSSPYENLPTLLVEDIGYPGNAIIGIDKLLSAASEVSPDLNHWIEIILPTASGVRLQLSGSVFADLGSPNDFSVPYKDLKAVLGQVELTCIQRIDVSIPENPVVERDTTRCN